MPDLICKDKHVDDYQIWSNPELAYEEHRAHDTICDFPRRTRLHRYRHAYGLETFEVLREMVGDWSLQRRI